MILPPPLARAALAGRKTQTRRPVKPGEKHCRYRPGHHYAIQPGPGRPATGRVEIVRVEQQALGDVAFADAKAEGFRTTVDFFDAWPYAADLEGRVWVIHHRPFRDLPRYLHRASDYAPTSTSPPGYTHAVHQAMDELEAVSEDEQAKITQDARNHRRVLRAEDDAKREERSLQAQLKELQARARKQGVPLDDEIGRVREALDRMRRRLDAA